MRREKSFRVFSCREQIKGRIKGIKKDGNGIGRAGLKESFYIVKGIFILLRWQFAQKKSWKVSKMKKS